MLDLDDFRNCMRKHRLRDISEATGIKYNRIWDLASGRNSNPTYKTMRRILDYTEKNNVSN